MIDFPSPATDQQVFQAPNGVAYKYSAANSAWLAQNPAPALGGTGDFTALYTSALTNCTGSGVAIPFNVVQSGNSGLWYNTANGRYMPPAGRYHIQGVVTFYGTSASPGTGIAYIRKNGIAIYNSQVTLLANGGTGVAVADGNFDANGSDYFEIAVAFSGSQIQYGAGTSWFSAFPLTGMQGPTGGAPGPVVGDFSALTNTAFTINLANTVVTPPVVTGNSGGYYNAANGRHTPPAGRYKYTGVFSGYLSTGSDQFQFQLRKNGVAVEISYSTSPAANLNTCAVVDAILDMNGSDFVDFTIGAGAVSTNGCTLMAISATPTQGMVGPQGPPGPSGPQSTGDFCANATSSFPGLTTTPTTLVVSPVISGNTGNYYNVTTGVWTPPAGRYSISASYSAHGSVANTQLALSLRKNGAIVQTSTANSNAATNYGQPSIELNLDANGTDAFDIQGSTSTGTGTLSSLTFSAFPFSGIQGPMGPTGAATGSDFYVQMAAATFPLANSVWTTVLFNKLITANSGNFYASSSGRYTPPAGRYFIASSINGYSPTAVSGVQIQIRKNGTVAEYSAQYCAVTGANAEPQVAGIFDASGSDWFDIQAQGATADTVGIGNGSYFVAFPIGGMMGPQGPPGVAGVTPGFLYGLTLSSSQLTGATASITVAAGQCVDSANAVMMQNVAPITKLIASAWVAGNGNGGLGQGVTRTASTWYHMFGGLVGGVFDMFYDTDPGGANKPAAFTSIRRLGSVRTLTGAPPPLRGFRQDGDFFQWTGTPQNDFNVNAPGTAVVNRVVFSPLGLKIMARLSLNITNNSTVTGAYFSYGDPDVSVSTATMQMSLTAAATAPGNIAQPIATVDTMTDTASRIATQAVSLGDANVTLAGSVVGWFDTRGRTG